MNNIRSKIIKKITIVAFLLSLIIGSIMYFIEIELIDQRVSELASNETIPLLALVNNVQGIQAKYDTLAKHAENILSSHFLIVEMYKKDKTKFFEKIDEHDKAIEEVVDQITHNFPLENKIIYEKFYVDNTLYLQVLVPLKDKDSNIFGYLEGVYKVDDQQLSFLNQRVFFTILQTILVVVITTSVLTPIIFSLNKNLFSYSQKLLRANVDLLKVLGSAISKRDTDTNAHNYRVTIYAVKLAEQIHLNQFEIQKLIKGAFVHDVGKIGITDQILLKPGKLTEEEFEVMKTHVQHGEDIIKEAEWLEDARDTVAYHHEKYNGTGYLKGLSGDHIPLNARIFAIADVFDALTSERPYKKAFSYEKAIDILIEGKGTHFDPHLIDGFLNISQNLYDQIANCEENRAQQILDELLNKYFYDSSTK